MFGEVFLDNTPKGNGKNIMGIGFTLLLILHVIVCLFLILLVLVQNDKGGGLAGAFGGMGGSAAFTGSSTVTILTRITQGAAVAAFVVLLGLNYLSLNSNRAAQSQSELKGARRGLSAVLPPSSALPLAPQGQQAPAQIPGLGGGSAPASTPQGASPGNAN
jgi:preprotein translocase subunit SecG